MARVSWASRTTIAYNEGHEHFQTVHEAVSKLVVDRLANVRIFLARLAKPPVSLHSDNFPCISMFVSLAIRQVTSIPVPDPSML